MQRSPERSVVRLLTLCVVLACESEPTTPSSLRGVSSPVAAVTDNRLATFAVSPDSQMVFAGDTFLIRALPRNRAGELLERSITWTIGNSNIIRSLGTTQTGRRHLG